MKKIDIGSSGLTASAIGIGCMRFADMETGRVDRFVNEALEQGITLFDHADIYGGGQAEAVFGQVLAGNAGLRERMVLQTKCGIREGWFDLSGDHIVASAEASLKRLKTGYLDLLLLHRPDTLMEPEEIGKAFEKLKAEGKVRKFGVSNMNPAQISMLQKQIGEPLIVNQLQFSAASTSIVDSGINANIPAREYAADMSVLEYCREHQVTIQTWSSLQYGWFEGTFLNNPKYQELNAVLDCLGEKYGISAAAVAIAWILRHPAGMQAIVGTTNAERMKAVSLAGDVVLERKEWYDIYRAAGNRLP